MRRAAVDEGAKEAVTPRRAATSPPPGTAQPLRRLPVIVRSFFGGALVVLVLVGGGLALRQLALPPRTNGPVVRAIAAASVLATGAGIMVGNFIDIVKAVSRTQSSVAVAFRTALGLEVMIVGSCSPGQRSATRCVASWRTAARRT